MKNVQLHQKINSKMHEIVSSQCKAYEKEVARINEALGSGWYVGKALQWLRTRKYKLKMKEHTVTNRILIMNNERPYKF